MLRGVGAYARTALSPGLPVVFRAESPHWPNDLRLVVHLRCLASYDQAVPAAPVEFCGAQFTARGRTSTITVPHAGRYQLRWEADCGSRGPGRELASTQTLDVLSSNEEVRVVVPQHDLSRALQEPHKDGAR